MLGRRPLIDQILEYIYPSLCWNCQMAPAEDQHPFCSDCLKRLQPSTDATCPRCATTVGPFSNVIEGCFECRNAKYHFDQAIRFGLYRDDLRDLILRMKLSRSETLVEVMAKYWVKSQITLLQGFQADLIIPVPLNRFRRWRRGFNQAEILAREWAKALNCEFVSNGVIRTRRTQYQSELSATSRRENVKNAFHIRNPKYFLGKHIIMVDDVMSSGATASELAKSLKSSGAVKISVAVLARPR
jgi:ComF family protein